MNILEFAERIYPHQLTELQKEILVKYEYSRNNNIALSITCPPRNGRTMIAKIIEKWESEYNDKE